MEPVTQKPMTELEILKMRMNKTTDESLESTRRMVQLAAESQNTGAATMEQLASQGDQLRRVDGQMDVIHTDIQQAERNLEEMDKCCGLCVLPWKRSKKPTSDKLFKQPHSNNQSMVAPSTQASQRQPQQFNTQPTSQPQMRIPGQGQYITRITNDAREDEMEANLQEVSHIVGDLRVMATDMNQEIREHNEIVERIDQKADANQERLRQAQARAERIVGQPKPKPESGPNTTSVGLTAAKYLM